ncbi:MAG TPA: hypothetical protein DDY14_03075 [Chromatiaceae bacterium]|jgi:hypothetical protein|nr:MAG: hypothetical protein N838_28780 [Thiohalocapsa sp. PB-PSB1]QQO56953.1 MAG: hypothetical protein N838_29985 [Thiohalocapsa sp. PB-PSB1]HBG94311.1 hypothetical protein [Chromatiaceae bacterium]HCS89807.1 hypothetical protein [Chromatiaceae bacterium]
MNRDNARQSSLLTRTAHARAAWVQFVAQLYRVALASGTLEIVQSSPPVFAASDLNKLIMNAREALPSRIAAAYSSHCSLDAFPGPAGSDRQGTLAFAQVRLSQSESQVTSADSRFLVRINEDGEPLRGGAPEASLTDYAEAMLEVWLAQPSSLHELPEWLDRLLDDDGTPTAELVAMIPEVQALATAFIDDSPEAPGFLRRQLLERARKSSLPLDRLLDPWHWRLLAHAELSTFILTLPERLAPRERDLQAAAVDALATGSTWQLRDADQPWQRPDDPAWWERLRALAGGAPQLIPTPLLADLGRGLYLDALPAPGVAAILAAEMREGSLWRRRFQAENIAQAVFLPGVVPVMLKATAEKGDRPRFLQCKLT